MQNPLSDPERLAELVAKLQARLGVDGEGREGDAVPLRYVIYARKSTDTAEKQERSIGATKSEKARLLLTAWGFAGSR